jgi:hypothetical protein
MEETTICPANQHLSTSLGRAPENDASRPLPVHRESKTDVTSLTAHPDRTQEKAKSRSSRNLPPAASYPSPNTSKDNLDPGTNDNNTNVSADKRQYGNPEDSDSSVGKMRAQPTSQRNRKKPLKLHQTDTPDAPKAMPGSLVYMLEEAKGDATIDEMELADHIIKWTDILTKGPHAFEKALSKERRRMNPTPIVFAIMESRSNKVQLAHGFEDIVVDDEEHDANERVGFFLGDRVTIIMNNVPTQHDPPFWTVTTFDELTSQFKGKHANTVAFSKAKGALILGNPRTSTINIPNFSRFPCCGGVSSSQEHKW